MNIITELEKLKESLYIINWIKLSNFVDRLIKKLAIIQYNQWKKRLLPSDEFDLDLRLNCAPFVRHLPEDVFEEYQKELIKKRYKVHELDFARE